MTGTLREQVEDLLYEEAELLDNRQFRQWLELLTDDFHYWMPVRDNRVGDTVEDELSKPGQTAFFDDTKKTLTMRIDRLETGQAWAETPPSRTRHIVSNVRVRPIDGSDELEVQSNFFTYRTRLERDEDFYVGTRRDILRRVDGNLRFASRTIILDQAVLKAKNISIFL